MTNKEAIDLIITAIAQVEWDYPMGYATAFDKAIEALELIEASRPVEPDYTASADTGAKPIPWNDLEISCGAGWVEIWYEPEDGEPENFEIMRCVWLFGNLMVDDGCHSTTDAENLKRMYNKQYGQRVWTNCPTEEQRKAAKWMSTKK